MAFSLVTSIFLSQGVEDDLLFACFKFGSSRGPLSNFTYSRVAIFAAP